jgi:hypothetical protein
MQLRAIGMITNHTFLLEIFFVLSLAETRELCFARSSSTEFDMIHLFAREEREKKI